MLKQTSKILETLYAHCLPHTFPMQHVGPRQRVLDTRGGREFSLPRRPALVHRYDHGLLEHDTVVEWHAQKPMGEAGEKIRTAALPFIKWLRGPEGEEEEYSAAYWASVEASEPPDLAAAPPEYDAAMQCPTPTDFENLKVA